MKIRILKIIIPLLIIVFAIIQGGGLNLFNKDITVRAVGDLNVIWGVPDGDPIFVVSNMLPGDSEESPVILDQFFTDSTGPDGIPLSTLGPGDSTTYTFKVTFDETAGNEFQEKQVIFDLIIGIAIAVPEECQEI